MYSKKSIKRMTTPSLATRVLEVREKISEYQKKYDMITYSRSSKNRYVKKVKSLRNYLDHVEIEMLEREKKGLRRKTIVKIFNADKHLFYDFIKQNYVYDAWKDMCYSVTRARVLTKPDLDDMTEIGMVSKYIKFMIKESKLIRRSNI
jgi:hypothetical protein